MTASTGTAAAAHSDRSQDRPGTAGTAVTARARWDAARAVGAGLGAVYLAVGVVGALMTGLVPSWSHATSVGSAHLIGVFQVNPAHNVAHLGLGAALVVGAVLGQEAARGVDRVVGLVFALLALLGPLVMGGGMDPIALNDWDHLLHLGTAGALLAAVWATRPPRAAARA